MTSKEFSHFLKYFPELHLPLSITKDSVLTFSQTNQALPQDWIHIFFESLRLDEFSEIIPGVSIHTGFHFHTLLFWELRLLDYRCHLWTFDVRGNHIDSRLIATMKVDGMNITERAAVISEDLVVYNIQSQRELDDHEPINTEMDKRLFEITETGKFFDL